MKKTIAIILASTAFCFALSAIEPAQAYPPEETLNDLSAGAPPPATSTVSTHHKKTTHHKKKRSKKKHSKKTVSHSNSKARIRMAQDWLEQLGFNPGTPDGIMGKRTKAALKNFQRSNHLKVTGTLTDATFRALAKESGHPTASASGDFLNPPPPDFLASHPDFYGYYGKEGVNPNSMSLQQPIPSRFGTATISEEQNGQTYTYTVTYNNQPLVRAEQQPSYVNVSRTFNLDDSDAVLITFYANNGTCQYRHQLLVMGNNGGNVREINSCAREYQAYTENGMLMLNFPGSHTDGYSSGESWRFDHGTLTKL